MTLKTVQSLHENLGMECIINADKNVLTIFSRHGKMLGEFSLDTGERV